MRRRRFITALGAAAAFSLAIAHAQRKTMPVIGVFGAAAPDHPAIVRNIEAFRQGLADTGYVEGQNVAIEYRWAGGDYDRLPDLAAELVALNVSLIVNEGGAPSVLAAKNATATIPIVFHTATDPVASKFVASLARPGGNLTGVTVLIVELSAKLLELITELVPQARKVGLLVNPGSPNTNPMVSNVREGAEGKRLDLLVLQADSVDAIDKAFAELR
jgi:putative ABC transport system substrate-binding protein